MSSLADILIADNSKKNSPLQSKAAPPGTSSLGSSPRRRGGGTDFVDLEPEPAAPTDDSKDSKINVETSQPLAPPPRPAQQIAGDTPDYFSGVHNGSHFSLEPNPFEQSFGNPSSEAPGKTLLPSVAALTSPALPGANSASGYNWPNSLRSGPLSPAMLAGPAGSGDYFDGIGRGFPTPNESSLRTGLTPGGGGSMFPVPAPSPNSQAIFNSLANGGATPGTLDFHRTAMNAAAARKNNVFGQTSNPQEQEQLAQQAAMDSKAQQGQNDPFAQHDATDAANGLFMLAKGGPTNNQFAVPNQPIQQQAIQSKVPQQMGMQSQDSQAMAKRAARNASGSLGSISGSAQDMSGDMSDSPGESSRPNTRGKGKRNPTAKAAQAANGRRKADETPSKPHKRSKGNGGNANLDPNLEPQDSDDEEDMKMDEHDSSGKKMTDEEKRKNFLERNRYES